MADVRDVFWQAVNQADRVLRLPDVERGWPQPSALSGMSVGDLAAHVTRALTTVATYLAGTPATGEPSSPASYFVKVLEDPADISSAVNDGIRQRSRKDAAGGWRAVLARWDGHVREVREQLENEPPDRLLAAAGGVVLTVDDYLATRVVELAVHTDDLAVSVSVDAPPLPAGVAEVVAHTLIDIARLRNGDLPVVRALARRERETAGLLRVF